MRARVMQPNADMPNQNVDDDDRSIEHADRERTVENYGGGQSGYGAGRHGGDRSMGSGHRNQTGANKRHEDRQGVRTDERFTGRGGEGYWEDRSDRTPSAARTVGDGNDRQSDGKGPQGYMRSDDRLTEAVSEALRDDDDIDATHIEVVVKNGEVMLTGTVDDRQEQRLAEDLIERLPGVKDVQNGLRLAGRGNPKAGSAVGNSETETSSEPKHRA
jgi:hypothetical protein